MSIHLGSTVGKMKESGEKEKKEKEERERKEEEGRKKEGVRLVGPARTKQLNPKLFHLKKRKKKEKKN